MTHAAMRDQFERIFPEWGAKFRSATSQEQVLGIQDQFLSEYREKLRLAFQEASAKHDGVLRATSGKVDEVDAIVLKADKYKKLVDARGDDIHLQIQFILDGLERLQKLGTTADPEDVTAELLGFGSLAIGGIAGLVAFGVMVTGISVGGATLTFSAGLAGVLAVGVTLVVAAAAVILALIFIPLVYFMVKPAICIIFLINELPLPDEEEDQEKYNKLFWEGDYNVHGKPTLLTREIPGALRTPSQRKYPFGGLYATAKHDDALFGTQFGFVMKYRGAENDPFVRLTFATECPLTGVNNCYCAFDESAESAARETARRKEQFFEARKDGLTLSIRCNSSSGPVAWYVARLYRD